MNNRPHVPVITLDGPSGSGKGTISRHVAAALGWHLLDSGALYRLVALAARKRQISISDEPRASALAAELKARFEGEPEAGETRIFLDGEEVTEAIRTEQCSRDASRVAVLPAVRQALLEQQRRFCAAPGLVADGRDMGTVVFPAADLKIFLTASQEERAQRRYNQLKQKGVDVNLSDLLEDIGKRDERDHSRRAAPMRPASDAIVVDTTGMGIDEVTSRILNLWRDNSAQRKA